MIIIIIVSSFPDTLNNQKRREIQWKGFCVCLCPAYLINVTRMDTATTSFVWGRWIKIFTQLAHGTSNGSRPIFVGTCIAGPLFEDHISVTTTTTSSTGIHLIVLTWAFTVLLTWYSYWWLMIWGQNSRSCYLCCWYFFFFTWTSVAVLYPIFIQRPKDWLLNWLIFLPLVLVMMNTTTTTTFIITFTNQHFLSVSPSFQSLHPYITLSISPSTLSWLFLILQTPLIQWSRNWIEERSKNELKRCDEVKGKKETRKAGKSPEKRGEKRRGGDKWEEDGKACIKGRGKGMTSGMWERPKETSIGIFNAHLLLRLKYIFFLI